MRSSAVLRVALVLVLLASGSWLAAAPKPVTTVEGMSQYVLDNGLNVLLFPDPTRPTVTVNLTVLVGSRHEGYGEAGMAHLLEHMLFKGTPKFPDMEKALTERGARYNGSTWVDRTNYFETLPAGDENLQFAVELEADRLVHCPIKAEQLASEMTVVRNEFEMGENNPANVLEQRMLAVAYEWHNYGKSTIGNRSDIERVPADRLRRFYQKYYQPDNALLIVAGRFDPPKALAWIDKHFGAIPRPQRTLEATYTEEPAQDGERTVTLRRVGDVSLVMLLYHVVAGPHEEFPAVRAVAEILGDTPSGRLHKALVETKKAAEVFGFAPALHDPGYLMLGALVRGDQPLDEVRRILQETADQLAGQGATEEEVNRVRVRFVSERRRTLVDSSRLAVQLSEWAAQGDWRLFFLFRDRMEKLALKDANEVAKKYLRASNRTVGVFIPTKAADRTPVPPRPDVAATLKEYKGRAAVAPGEQIDPDPMKLEARITRQVLPGGLKVAMLPKKTRQEMVFLRLTLRYGNEENLQGMVTAADLLPQLMARGTRQLSRQQLKDAFDKLEATLGAGGSTGTLSVSVQAPRANLGACLDLVRQVLREPALADSEFDTLRREALAGLEWNRSEPQALASRALARKLNPYPKGDVRYTPTIDEEIAWIKEVKCEQVRELYAQYVGAQAAELAVVGDFDPGNIVPAVAAMLEGWKAPLPYTRITHRAPEGLAASLDVIRTPDKANAVYLSGLTLAMKDTDPDYPALLMASEVLGGSAAARLFQRVREKEGLSYGVGASFSARPLDPVASLRLFAICNPANVDKAKQAIFEESQKLVQGGITAEELRRERDALLNQRNMDRSQDSALAGLLAGQLHTSRTMKDVADQEAKIRALTPEQVSATVKKDFDPTKLVIVTAGDFAAAAKAKPAAKP